MNSKLPKSAQRFMDEEFADDKRRTIATEKAFGKNRVVTILELQDQYLDLLGLVFGDDIKKVESITLTVQVKLKNGKKLGYTACNIPNMPKRVTDMINAAGKKKMAKILKAERS